jgi:nitronate monooxygenase
LTALQAGTRRPYNVNFFCHPIPAFDAAREAAWRQLLQPYYSELGMEFDDTPPTQSRVPFNAAIADVVEPFRPPVVSFHFGLPAPTLLARVRSWGSKVLASATTVEEARWLEHRGVDAIIAQGSEAGGHRGMFLTEDLTTQRELTELLPAMMVAVRLPVIAAGGIGAAHQVAQALAQGAAGVQVGTAFLLCPEAKSSAVHRAAIKSAVPPSTAITNLFSGRPARGIVNRLMKELGPINRQVPAFPLASAALAALRSNAERQGRGDFSPLWCGTNLSACLEIDAGTLTHALCPATANILP